MSNTLDLREAGLIVGEATSTEFIFVSERERYPPKWEYLLVQSMEYVGGQLEPVDVLAQVERIVSESEVLTQQLDLEALKRIKGAGISDIKTWGQARVLGFLSVGGDGKEVLLPRRAVVPGQSIYIAPKELLTRFFFYPEEEGLHVGNLISRPDVPVYISVKGFRRHLAILAQTGAGKSYTAGVLIEELLQKGATIIVVDPHADYVFVSQSNDGRRYEKADRITVFRNPGSTGRYSEREVRNLRKYEVKFSDLEPYDIFQIAGISNRYVNIREALRIALRSLKGKAVSFLPKELIDEVDSVASHYEGEDKKDTRKIREAARSAKRHLRALLGLPVFGRTSVPITDILVPEHVSVIDLSGLADRSMDYVVSRILEEAYLVVKTGEYPYPVFVFIEEAHKFIPSLSRRASKTYSTDIINTLAAEGRKFGIFLVLISQRPFKIDSDSLSQCNSQIIMKITNPSDQNATQQSSERLSQNLMNDLPGLNTGEAVIVGEMTRVPVMVRIRSRETKEGGADIDIIEKLKEARERTQSEAELREIEQKTVKSRGDFSEV